MSDNCLFDFADSAIRPDFIKYRVETAKQPHQCCECGMAISALEQYEHVTGTWNDDFKTYKTCLPCVEIRDELFCSYIFTEMYNSLGMEVFEVDMAALERFSPAAQRKLIENLVLPWLDEED
jgi:hypothetical protein